MSPLHWQGGVILQLSGTNFKDRGFVALDNGITQFRCETPPLGQQGDMSGIYYGRDGKLIRVRSFAGAVSESEHERMFAK